MLAYTFYEADGRVMKYAEALAKRGDIVDVVALRKEGQPSFSIMNGVNVHRIQNRIVNEKSKLTYLYRLIVFFVRSSVFLTLSHFKKSYDLVHVHSVPDFEVFAAWFPKLCGSKIVLDIHDIVPEFYASKFNTGKENLLFKALIVAEKASIYFSTHVIIANHLWREKLINRSVNREKCSVILNYPDPSLFFGRPKTKAEDKFIMIYPGSLNAHQGLDVAIKAFALIKDSVPNIEFHIYGEGSEKKSLIALSLELGLEGKVLFKELLPLRKIVSTMAEADLGIVPKKKSSFGNEAYSTKILEFMALGVPVIVSDTKIDRYYFNGNLVKFFRSGDEKDLANCMLRLINDRGLRETLTMNSFKYIAENNWDKKKQEYLDLIDDITLNGSYRRAVKEI